MVKFNYNGLVAITAGQNAGMVIYRDVPTGIC